MSDEAAQQRAAAVRLRRPLSVTLNVMKDTAKNWGCEECHASFQYFGDPPDARCPSCGSVHLTRFLTAHDDLEVSVSEHLRLKCKDPSLPSKRKLRREVRIGRRPEASGSGRLVDERWIADADADNYEEKIVDVETGRVIRDVKELLSRHRGGSEKRQAGKKT